jgi:prepilin-type N-terminal cleavage/methylation domain-containing protein
VPAAACRARRPVTEAAARADDRKTVRDSEKRVTRLWCATADNPWQQKAVGPFQRVDRPHFPGPEFSMRHRQPPNTQRGFTLVEIAVVLVIIGLLLGAILKGQELVENSRVKNAANDFSSIKAAAYGYLDRYRSLPGDDGPIGTLQGRGNDWAPITVAGNRDGAIGAGANPFAAPTGEHLAFWQHLRAAGFLTGNPSDTGAAALAKNAFGGVTGIASLTTQLGGFNARAVCMSQVPGKGATALDNQLDDGKPGSGTVRATQQGGAGNVAPGAVAANYSEDQRYTVCTKL